MPRTTCINTSTSTSNINCYIRTDYSGSLRYFYKNYYENLFENPLETEKGILERERKEKMLAEKAKERLDLVKQKILAMHLDGELDEEAIAFLFQGVLSYCYNRYSLRSHQLPHIRGRWGQWSGGRATNFLRRVGVDLEHIRGRWHNSDSVNGYLMFNSLFSWVDECRHSSCVVSMLMFFKSLIDLEYKIKKYQEPPVAYGVDQWINYYNPPCDCGHCEWARNARHNGETTWCGNEFAATCDEELKSLIEKEGKEALEYLDEEDFNNPRLRQLFSENKLEEICEVLQVA